MTIDDIRMILGDGVFARALGYYERGAVVEYTILNNGEIRAKVGGSLDEPYPVSIDFNINVFRCSCRAAKPCKHIGAVLIYHCKKIGLPQSTSQRLAELEEKVSATREERVSLSDRGGPSLQVAELFGEKSRCAVKKPQRDNTGRARYPLIFTIEPLADEGRIILHPALLCERKEGRGAKVLPFREERLSVEPAGAAKVLLDALRGGTNPAISEITLSSYFAHIVRDNTLKCDIYTERAEPVVFKFFDRVEIFSDTVEEMDRHGSGVISCSFACRLSLHHKRRALAHDIAFSSLFTHGGIVFVMHENTVYYNDRVLNLYSFFNKLQHLRRRNGLTRTEISLIQAWASSHLAGLVDIIFDYTTVRIKSALPKCIIECTEAGTQTGLTFFFRYGDREYPLELNDIPRVHTGEKSGDKVLTLVRRSAEYERLFARKIFETVREHVIDGERVKRRFNFDNTSDLFIDLDISTLLAEYARGFFDEGVELRIAKKQVKSASKGSVKIKLSSGINWFGATAVYIDEGGSGRLEIDPALLKAGIVKVRGGYVQLSKSDTQLLASLRRHGMNGSGTMAVHCKDLAAIHELYKNEITDERNLFGTLSDIFEKLSGFMKIDETPLPREFGGTLRPYQRDGYNWLHFLRKYDLNGILADDMGLGKTVQTLALLQSLKERGELFTSLLVVPVSTIPNWSREIERFTPGLTSLRQIGGGREKEIARLQNFDLLITSYQTLARDVKFLKNMKFCYVILDESQNIKNSKTISFKTVRLLSSQYRLSLTGTPIENNSAELWSQMDFLNPGLLGSMNKFKSLYGRPIEIRKDEEKVQTLRKKIYPFMLRRRKQEVAKDLPPKEEVVLFAQMDSQQKRIYEHLREECEKEAKRMMRYNWKGKVIDISGEVPREVKPGADENEEAPNNFFIFVLMLKLRQIALFPQLVDRQYLAIESCKFELLKEKIEEILSGGNKLLIFSQFVRVLSIIRTYLDQKGYAYAYLDGSTKNRESVIDSFQNDESLKLFLISLKAGGVGINLTAADYVILFDPWWNPAVENQAVDRAHRIGRKNKVIVYRLIARDTIEERMLELQAQKRDLFDKLITTDAGFFKSLTSDDLMGLFR